MEMKSNQWDPGPTGKWGGAEEKEKSTCVRAGEQNIKKWKKLLNNTVTAGCSGALPGGSAHALCSSPQIGDSATRGLLPFPGTGYQSGEGHAHCWLHFTQWPAF